MDKQKFPIQVEVVTFSKRIAKQVTIEWEYFLHPSSGDKYLGWIARDAMETDSREMIFAQHGNGDIFLIPTNHGSIENRFNIKLDQIFLV